MTDIKTLDILNVVASNYNLAFTEDDSMINAVCSAMDEYIKKSYVEELEVDINNDNNTFSIYTYSCDFAMEDDEMNFKVLALFAEEIRVSKSNNLLKMEFVYKY